MKIAALFGVLVIASTANTFAVTTVSHGQKTSVLTVRGSVATTCTLSTSPFSFSIGVGYIHAPNNVIVKQNSLSVKCTKGAATQISMNSGLYGSAAGSQFGSRSMKDAGGDYLGYELCHDSSCSSVWRTGFGYVSPSDAGSSLPIFTRIKTGQSQAKQGSYSDSVTVTINF